MPAAFQHQPYSGSFTFDGKAATHHVDVSWNEAWTGTAQVRNPQLEGRRLIMSTNPQAGSDGQRVVGVCTDGPSGAHLSSEVLSSRGDPVMLYMVIEYFNAGAAPEIYRRVRDRGRRLPPGLEYVDSWVDLDYFRCFQLMRTEDRSLFDIWAEAWGDLAHLEIIPVRTSKEAAQHIADKL